MKKQNALIAVTRFGLGASPGELHEVKSDPRAWLNNQLLNAYTPKALDIAYSGKYLVPEYLDNVKNARAALAEKKTRQARQIYMRETGQRALIQIQSTQPLIERLIIFWSNHFTVSAQKTFMALLVNEYEVQAIRANLNGTFYDMLLAVCQHPAMLFYLDNAQSFGPNSVAGKRLGKGLNENLAREVLELHTLGVDGGYSQADVIALAKIITGWGINKKSEKVVVEYKFQEQSHEPGNKVLLGRTFQENGEQEGIQALKMLANHPATAKHIATKLARQFIQDIPPESAVQALTKSFIDSGGHLPTVMQTLINLEAAWQLPAVKFKTPYEFAISAFRLTSITPTELQVMASFDALNFRPFYAPSPAGYDDFSAAWMSPDALMKRIEWSKRLAQRVPGGVVPLQLATEAFDGEISVATKNAIERAPSGSEGIALLLASPEFQRR